MLNSILMGLYIIVAFLIWVIGFTCVAMGGIGYQFCKGFHWYTLVILGWMFGIPLIFGALFHVIFG